MRAVIISGGSISDYSCIKSHIKENDFIICADSGYDHAVFMNLSVNVIIGDFDSIKNNKFPENVEIVRHLKDKDQTDTELSLNFAREKGFKNFLFLAAVGSRIDHSLANILLLKDITERGEEALIINENNKVMMINSSTCLTEELGLTLSLIPISDCLGVSTKGLKYQLKNDDMLMGKSLGISNVITEEEVEITLRCGLLLIVIAKD